MSRRLYLMLVLARLYFALQPSYVHPDEHFQGPEVITGDIFGWPVYRTWEFTSGHPIRSIFPLWLVYRPPLTIFKWICHGLGYQAAPIDVFYALRLFMFLLSFVLQDWALHELLLETPERSLSLLLVASSYVTGTYQMHTFSNSIETIIVLWCLVLMRRLQANKDHVQIRLCVALSFLGTLGVFNRITFPAYLAVAAAKTLPHLVAKPLRLLPLAVAASLTAMVAIAIDTEFYRGHRANFTSNSTSIVCTPWNNLVYNLDAANLAQHGLHPHWHHLVLNLAQLIGPAYPLLLTNGRKDTLFWSAIGGIGILSCFKHQEARFLTPAVPLLLSAIKLPTRRAPSWLYLWAAFNMVAAVLFGIYHQGGVVPVQSWIGKQSNVSHVLWWKTYSPPRWLLGTTNVVINTTDLMGMPGDGMLEQLAHAADCRNSTRRTLLVAPLSATFLDAYTDSHVVMEGSTFALDQIHLHRAHIGLDDLDWGEDGVWPTLRRVVGRRGLGIWTVQKEC
ncbi:glycosyltransferase family 22 protein [Baudoinia panamericana UAMH 10762]|uniref:Mannosyltransferase n=1 Tax=Baudoinia panamericana (strain UAMH 10762) TaxID=717646 RepID=M2N0Y6_BAUPA|nr:glycosyltransferase family 22 protein [Baudoinia panamericana UAMH 10762]EMC97588.1 glycosyltransferase family 22 protein [Baudoinia panamericana UAMH 10762]